MFPKHGKRRMMSVKNGQECKIFLKVCFFVSVGRPKNEKVYAKMKNILRGLVPGENLLAEVGLTIQLTAL